MVFRPGTGKCGVNSHRISHRAENTIRNAKSTPGKNRGWVDQPPTIPENSGRTEDTIAFSQENQPPASNSREYQHDPSLSQHGNGEPDGEDQTTRPRYNNEFLHSAPKFGDRTLDGTIAVSASPIQHHHQLFRVARGPITSHDLTPILWPLIQIPHGLVLHHTNVDLYVYRVTFVSKFLFLANHICLNFYSSPPDLILSMTCAPRSLTR